MDLKQFLEENSHEDAGTCIYVIELGEFFWERRGKQFVNCLKGLSIEDLIKIAKINVEKKRVDFSSRDFLDALACLGEEKVKELIKELGA